MLVNSMRLLRPLKVSLRMNDLKRYTIQGFIPHVTAICDECIKEIQDKMNPRYMYPDCGPKLVLLDNNGRTMDSIHPVVTARQMLHEGRLAGIKGIGGYHIACNACDEKAIDLLRKRKIRPDKPLAIMAANLEAAKLICRTTDKEEEILTSRQRPIVLLQKTFSELLPHNIAPGINRLGVMLPYTPLHHLLFHEELQYLIMTSGGMPSCYKDEEALEKLKNIVDFFLVHDREILTPIDDSVVQVIDEKEMVSRSARGYSPSTFQIDSVGRLFDCVSALVMKRTHITYDAQEAIELESIIEPGVTDFYSYSSVF